MMMIGGASVASQASTGAVGSGNIAAPTAVPFGAAMIGVAGLAVALL